MTTEKESEIRAAIIAEIVRLIKEAGQNGDFDKYLCS